MKLILAQMNQKEEPAILCVGVHSFYLPSETMIAGARVNFGKIAEDCVFEILSSESTHQGHLFKVRVSPAVGRAN